MNDVNSWESEELDQARSRRMGDQLMAEVSRHRRAKKRKRILGVVLAGVLTVGAGTAGYWTYVTVFQHRYTVGCYEAPRLDSRVGGVAMVPSDISEAQSAEDLARSNCESLWLYGALGQPPGTPMERKYPVPKITICEDFFGRLSGFPTDKKGFCESIGLRDVNG